MQVSRREFGVAGPAAAAVTAALSALPHPALAAATASGQWEQAKLDMRHNGPYTTLNGHCPIASVFSLGTSETSRLVGSKALNHGVC
eukprot:5687609-Pyramimonas_sp.AAC.1